MKIKNIRGEGYYFSLSYYKSAKEITLRDKCVSFRSIGSVKGHYARVFIIILSDQVYVELKSFLKCGKGLGSRAWRKVHQV